ncbi:MAG: hypothetical protein HY269_05400 [Deltaproteobacteria bacterium]|nr:hypothetical protein [Deltaproteobacteria bacterium]
MKTLWTLIGMVIGVLVAIIIDTLGYHDWAIVRLGMIFGAILGFAVGKLLDIPEDSNTP